MIVVRAALPIALAALACRGAESPGPGAPDVPDAARCAVRAPATLRRLSRGEYARTVDALLRVPVDVGRLPHDDPTDAPWSGAEVTAWLDGASDVADRVAPDVSGCAPADARCVDAWIERTARLAFRGPVPPEELRALRAIAAEARQGAGAAADPSGGARAAAAAMLVSPRFLLRETGGDRRARDASRVAFLLWGSAPDGALLDAAARGALDGASAAADAARAMLRDPRARAGVGALVVTWLGVDDLHAVRVDAREGIRLDAARADALRREVEAFAARTVLDGEGTLGALLRDPAPREEGRAGVLTLPAVLLRYASTTGASAVARGRFVRERLLCQTLPSPPPGLAVALAAGDDGDARLRLARHAADPACAGCHRLLDPVGLAFERFDGLGRLRPGAVDARGELTRTLDADGPVDGAPSLAARLAASRQARECVVDRWAALAAGRPMTRGDECALAPLRARFEASGGDLRALLVDLAASPFALEAPAEAP